MKTFPMKVHPVGPLDHHHDHELTDAQRYVSNIIVSISYKPGWYLSFYKGGLRIRTLLPDSFETGDELTETNHCFVIPDEVTNYYDAVDFVYRCIEGVERHETREFFRVGKVQYNPPPHGAGVPYEEMYG